MLRNFVDTVGEWNPQLFRELKGRFKPINLIAVSAGSLLMQLVVFLFNIRDIPGENYSLTSGYCRLGKMYLSQRYALEKQKSIINEQLNGYYSSTSGTHKIVSNLQTQNRDVQTKIDRLQEHLYNNEICPADAIEWQSWWSHHWGYIFLCFSVIFVFILLVAGTYAIINDLAREEKRGTLNFIRLSPQSEKNILTGKILGVPSLIYLFVLIAIPLHLWAGYAAKVSLVKIFSYYLILSASCYFFYSASMLLGLTSRWFSSFLPWLGSGTVLIFLSTTSQLYFTSYNSDNFLIPINWFGLISPWGMISYLFRNQWFDNFYNHSSILLPISKLEFFSLPIGKFLPTLLGFHLLNYIISTHGIWQAIKRSFRHTKTTLLSKRHSYFLAAFFQIILIGLSSGVHQHPGQIVSLVILNTILCLVLILALSPQRQIVQEWARYRHQENNVKSLWRDLILGEKSPVGLAILINLVITWTPTTLWIFFSSREVESVYWLSKSEYLLGVILFVSLVMIYTTIAQLILLVKSSQRTVWSISTFAFVVLLPTLIPLLTMISEGKLSRVWLFSPFLWIGIHDATITEVFMSILADLAIAVLLNVQLTRQLKSLGESSSKALLVG